MTEKSAQQPENNIETEYPRIEYVARDGRQRPSLLRRAGCGVLLVIWFTVLLLPLLLFVLAVEGNITISHRGDVPDKIQHPRFQAFLLMEPEVRGLQFTRSSVKREGNRDLCIQVTVSYLLWEGEGIPAAYCDCYARESGDADWQYVNTIQPTCTDESD